MNLEVFFAMKSKICCVTGHRPNKFPWDYYDKENESHKEYLPESKKVEKILLNYFSKLKEQENRSNEPNENQDIFF